ncbi:MAG: hypothetical protein VX418_00515 [Pseudomonadota bacterium]|jgi:hypothetical protein|nr:hypothetical protein [Pseudomonadota bacterium]|tara:strand:- start:18 stop:1004 length:987 start_codon:yes stop_codon:yes gene_type:complete
MNDNTDFHLLKSLKNKAFLMGISLWLIATFFYFLFVHKGLNVSPIAIDGLNSLLTIYMPVLVLAVFLLLYLTRKREEVNWAELYAVKKSSAKKEAWLSLIYLIITQLILGAGFNMGLHFPGTDIYSTGSHSQVDVWVWAITYTIIYTILPLIWLKRRGFSLKKLFSSFKWIRDLWIIIVYWAIDFFGPILVGSADFFGGISVSQYAQGVPLGILVNSLGAGLPVVVMMHIIFIPRIAVLLESRLLVVLFGGLFYSIFSLFDQGVDYSTLSTGLTSFTYIIMTQTLVGMGKATFTVVTGNPFIHFITLHIISARVPFDTRMYIEIFKLK